MFDTKRLPKPILSYSRLEPYEQTSMKIESQWKIFIWKKNVFANVGHFVSASVCSSPCTPAAVSVKQSNKLPRKLNQSETISK